MSHGSLVWRIERHEVVESTNALATERVRKLLESAGEPPTGLVIVAERQNAGRGQHGREWESPTGGLYLSAVVDDMPAELRDKLALVAGVAVAEGLAGFLPKHVETGARSANTLGLRWPNDVMLAGRKVAGVLCESVAMGAKWAGIIGIGVNVNTSMEALPAELRQRATSMAAALGETQNMRAVETVILEKLGTGLSELHTARLTRCVARARELDVLRGKRVELQHGERVLRGLAAGISDQGELMMRLEHTEAGAAPLTAVAVGSLISVAGVGLRH